MDPSAAGDKFQRRRSSPIKSKDRSAGSSVGTGGVSTSQSAQVTEPAAYELPRSSSSHEPRTTPPRFVVPASELAPRCPRPVGTAQPQNHLRKDSRGGSGERVDAAMTKDETPDRRSDKADSENGIAVVVVSPETEIASTKLDGYGDVDRTSSSTTDVRHDTVIQLNCGTTEIVLDGGNSRSLENRDGKNASEDDGADADKKKESDVEDGEDGGRPPDCCCVITFLRGIHEAWICGVELAQGFVHGMLTRHQELLTKIFHGVCIAAFFVYLAFATWYNAYGARAILSATAFVLVIVLLRLFFAKCGKHIDNAICAPIRGHDRLKRPCLYLKWFIYCCLITAVIGFIVFDISVDTKRLTSLAGMFVFLLLGFLTSNNPSKVKWRPVFWGLGLQFVLGLLILRWDPGYRFFRFLGDEVRVFLEYADEGSKFVFGENYIMHPMAFKVFPIIIYFSAVISIFYYWGLMQFVVCKIAWLMQFTMRTTAIESLNAACNIFVGMAESCVIMRPFLYKLTKSELHAVMTGGFATVAGSYIALLIEVGASPEHLLSAAIMSAPAALAMAKLSYPETEVSHTKTEEDVYMENLPARNLAEAASNGAIAAIKVVSSVAANLIAILGLIAFLNSFLTYLGGTVGIPELSFQMICSYVFWPLAAIMGVEIEDAGRVASLLGTKIFADEFISFRDLGVMVCAKGIQDRSMVIATYACCGFGSIAAVGIYIGALISVAPDRRGDIVEVALRAVINGNVAGFLTACIAGILYTGSNSFHADGWDPNQYCGNNSLLASMTASAPSDGTV